MDEIELKQHMIDYLERLQSTEVDKIYKWVRRNSGFKLPMERSGRNRIVTLGLVSGETLAEAILQMHDLDFIALCPSAEDDTPTGGDQDEE